MTRTKTTQADRLPSPASKRPAPAIWSAHGPALEAARLDPDHRAAKIIHDMKTSFTPLLLFTGQVKSQSDSAFLRVEASSVLLSLEAGRSMLEGFLKVSAQDPADIAGMMTGMVDDLARILVKSRSLADYAFASDSLPQYAYKMHGFVFRHLDKAEDLLAQLRTAAPRPAPRRPVDVPALLRNVMGMAADHTLAAEKSDSFILSFSIEGELPLVHGDEAALERVFSNLVINALHAMPDGGKIQAEAKLHGESILVSISDNGIGMDDETLARVFQPFFTTKGEEGTGLGLAIVDEVVKAHGGKVTVDSKPGEGTTFKISLPFKD